MSTAKEKLESISHAVGVAEKRVKTLETLQSVSKLHKGQIYELDMAKECVKRGKAILKEHNYEQD